MVEAYVHDNNTSVDCRAPHHSGKPVSLERLAGLGVHYRYCSSQQDVDAVARDRHYSNRDEVTISPAGFPSEDAFRDKLAVFYTEHLHEDEEIRYALAGEGYFDLRDATTGDWIRVKLTPGDLLIVPAGIYHRFTVTESNFIRAQRLFKDEPKWQAFNRPEGDARPVRKEYLASLAI
ncbi:AaceriADR021Wp [[Ashbya] aceris (nom. inval.)]|nr:AaceriADR021Wp [[Ashbya] aceris (nom. inval.)]